MENSCALWRPDASFDKRALRRDFSRAAGTYEDHADLQVRVAARVAEVFSRLKGSAAPAGTVLDAGSGTGLVGQSLAELDDLPETLIALDLAHPMTRRGRCPGHPALTGDCEGLPLAGSSLDGVVSSLTLQWVNDLRATLAGFVRCLREGGTLAASTLARGTLGELEEALKRTGEGGQVGPFLPPGRVADVLEESGLEGVRCWEETITQVMDGPAEVLHTLKGLGAVSKAPGRRRGLRGRTRLTRLDQAYRAVCGVPSGPVPVTWRVIFLSGRKPGRR